MLISCFNTFGYLNDMLDLFLNLSQEHQNAAVRHPHGEKLL